MTDVGELVVRIKADTAQMQTQMRAATAAVKESADGMSSAFEHEDLKAARGDSLLTRPKPKPP